MIVAVAKWQRHSLESIGLGAAASNLEQHLEVDFITDEDTHFENQL